MKLRLNLLRGDGSHNLQITTDATATVGDVAAHWLVPDQAKPARP